MWFTEDPWPPLMILIVLAVVFGIAWNATRRGTYLLASVGLVLLGLVVLIAEEMIVTEAENVEAQVLALADAVVQGDNAKVMDFFSSEAENLKSTIGSRLEDIDVEEDLRITDLEVTLDTAGSQAQSHFRANGSVTWRTLTHTGPTRWNLTWQKENAAWKIIQVERLDPIKGNVISTWSNL